MSDQDFVDSNLEDMCGHEYDRGLGRVWVCSLPASEPHDLHFAYPWHNVADYKPLASWRGEELIGYSSLDNEWIKR
jgi:hypothetical protein